MANEIWHSYDESYTLYALIWRQTDDKVYDAVAGSNTFDTYTDVDIDDYDVPLTNHVDSDYHSVDFPSDISAGVYRVQVLHQVGGGIDADADVPVAQGEIYWDGTAEVNIYTTSETDIAAILAKLPTNYIMGSATQADQDTIILGGTVPDNTSTANSIKLAADASGANDIYNENIVVLTGGTGAGQTRLIADYVGAAKTAAVRNAWFTTPDNTTVYRIYPFSGILLSNTGLAVAATADTITLNASAQAVADVYVGHTIFISGGTGLGQARLITGYTAERVATVTPDWDVTPGAASSIYLILPVGRTYVDTLSAEAITAIWDQAMSDLSAGAPSATASALTALNYLYEYWRNKVVTDSANNEIVVYKDDGSTKLCESDISDDGALFTKGEFGAAD
jgi:hypothetical protein